MYGLSIAPITESVASTAFSGSDSNHRSRMCGEEQRNKADKLHQAVSVLMHGECLVTMRLMHCM